MSFFQYPTFCLLWLKIDWSVWQRLDRSPIKMKVRSSPSLSLHRTILHSRQFSIFLFHGKRCYLSHSLISFCALSFTLWAGCITNLAWIPIEAPFSYDERRWFANRRRRPRGPKQQRPRGPRRRFANWRCCRNRNPLNSLMK